MSEKTSVLFVCLGNICRSTMSEGVFQSLAQAEPYTDLIDRIDSCGTGAYHVGDSPDRRTMATLKAKGVKGYKHAARQLRPSDFQEFDYIFAMDSSNLSGTCRIQQLKAPDGKARVLLFGEYSGGKVEQIEDPYYGDDDGFEKAYEQAVRFSTNFLEELRGKEGGLKN
ncbi:hypothetical protein VC83_03067 [Pseudogymnoascus destructans]|uniref:Phosphotyrosine protein phosphatase I domain-containing protein n=2 Tax=Pseudogymnoascus destructans TaxID=655981 RepID=L8FPE5_PSED2|nr:uncharacterized protein VC83_03067 [Pseudogymnoascus destructans]ELR02855.1 hypothetical protein GMDG_05788 [Pseudogymnoascus destructans 20631-21]OAF59915.1 hypothetical protein VC83_03067 [Pseudogymnoascus destructans]